MPVTTRKSVSFDSIEIIQLQYSVGDNPSVSKGSVPISCDWDCHKRTTLPLEHFERIRPPKQPRVKKISPNTRKSILLRTGYSIEDIEKATNEAAEAKRKRTSTIHKLNKIGALKKYRSKLFPNVLLERLPVINAILPEAA